MRAKVIMFNLRILEDLLKLPEGTKITRVRQSWEQERTQSAEFLIEAPYLEEVPDYGRIPEGVVTIHTEFCPHCQQSYIKKSEI